MQDTSIKFVKINKSSTQLYCLKLWIESSLEIPDYGHYLEYKLCFIGAVLFALKRLKKGFFFRFWKKIIFFSSINITL